MKEEEIKKYLVELKTKLDNGESFAELPAGQATAFYIALHDLGISIQLRRDAEAIDDALSYRSPIDWTYCEKGRIMKCEPATRWGIKWRSKCKLDGERVHIIYEKCIPVMFRTRQQARYWIEEHYGYIRDRPDLREEPFGWKIPIAIKISISEI